MQNKCVAFDPEILKKSISPEMLMLYKTMQYDKDVGFFMGAIPDDGESELNF